MSCLRFFGLWLCLFISAGNAAESPATLPHTQPLTWEDDLADRMMDGLHRFVERKIEHAVANRQQFWKRDTLSPEAYEKSIAPNRERLKKIIGLVDRREPTNLEFISLSPANGIARIRWDVLDGVSGEGFAIEPTGKVAGGVVLLPDAHFQPQTVSDLLGSSVGDTARRLGAHGYWVVIPLLIDRSDRHSGNELVAFTNQPHREWIHRQAYHMGRHIIGLEVQKVLAAVEWLKTQTSQKIGVGGYGEGGLLAFFAAAVEPQIDVCLVSGYFGPHTRPWEEPIYRHVWSLHREFGDAELATLIAPRPLIVNHLGFFGVDGPSPHVPAGRRGGAAAGQLRAPSLESVRREFERIDNLIPQSFQNRILTVMPLDTLTEWVTERGIQHFVESLGGRYDHKLPLPDVDVATLNLRIANSQRRQVLELERFIQRLVRESDHTRDKFFPVTALALEAKKVGQASQPDPNVDRPSGQAGKPDLRHFSESTAKFREYFRNEVLGKFDDPLLPFNARSRKIYDKEKWVGYDVVLDVFPDVFAWGVLLLPKDLKPGEKRPVVVYQHGRQGVPKVVIENDEKAYHDYAAKLAERGFIVFAPHNPYRGEDKYRFLSRKANCVKASLFSFILAQHEQILNWLSSLPQVDPDRIAFYGLSYGGETAVRIPPLLDRYCLSICSADFNDWARKVCSTDAKYSFMFTVEWEMPYFDMGSTFNYAEMVALLAPRPFMVERGHWDGVAPDEWVAYEYAKVRRMYDTLGLGDRTDIEFFDGLHEINGKGTFEFLHKHLKWPKP